MDENNEHKNEAVEVVEIDYDDDNEDPEAMLAGEMQQVDIPYLDADADVDSSIDGAEAMEMQDDSVVTFSRHTASVFSVQIDPKSSSLAVSGGEDDKAYVWHTASGQLAFECPGHKDSVTCVTFSADSKFVATGDMSGLIQVWKVDTQKLVWSFETSDLEWLEWHHSTTVLLAGTVDGEIWMWKIPSGDTKTFQSHGSSTGVGRVMPDGKRICAGYQDGTVKVWDLKTGNQIHSISGHMGHESGVTCMDCHHDNNLVITGSTDVTAKVINTNTGKVVSTLSCNPGDTGSDTEPSVEAVGFSRSQQSFIATGTIAGDLTIWDLATMKARHTCKHEAGIVRLRWDATAPLVYTCCLDGVVSLWDGRSGKCESQWYGHTEEILDFDISRDSNILVTAAGDKTAKVFSLQTPDR